MGYYILSFALETLSSFEFFSTLDAVFNGLSDPTLEDSFNTRIFFYSHFEIAPCLFERIARQSCAFCNRR